MSTKNYVNNKKMYEVMKQYHEDITEKGVDNTKIPDYIGLCFMLIANKLATKSNFSGYSFKEEMISDGIENCIMYMKNFNPEKSTNPFAYFTQIIKFAFIRRIEREKKQQYIKIKNMQNLHLQDCIDGEASDSQIDVNNVTDVFVKDFEEKHFAQKKKLKESSGNTVNKFFIKEVKMEL